VRRWRFLVVGGAGNEDDALGLAIDLAEVGQKS
jgi:hypothetical protein